MQRASPQWMVQGGHQLSGTITTKGSKNSALAIISASLLTLEPVVLTNVPRISDVFDMLNILQSLGSQVRWVDDYTVRLQRAALLDVSNLDKHAAERTRAVILLVAGLAMDHADFLLPFPGGCDLGDRSLEPHADALQQLGLQLILNPSDLHVRHKTAGDSEKITVTLLESGDTVTENAILAAVAMKRTSVQICNASCNYMVQDLCLFLQRLDGVEIEGIGSPLLTIRRCDARQAHPVAYSILEDPIEAFFFIAAAVVTRSHLHVARVPVGFISLELWLLRKIGLDVEQGPGYAAANGHTVLCDLEILGHHGSLRALESKIHPNIYPFGVNVDNLPALGAMVAVCKGKTLLHDWMYERRASYFMLLEDFGVRVELQDMHRAYITGSAGLQAAECRLPPALRPASMVLLAALAAPGTSCLQDVVVLDRGYEDLLGRLQSLGGRIVYGDTDSEVQIPGTPIRSVM